MVDAPNAPRLTEHEQRIIALADKLWSDGGPRGAAFRAAAKEQFPDASLPEDNPAVLTLKTELEGTRKQLADFIEATKKEAEEASKVRTVADFSMRVDKAVQEYGLTEEGKTKLINRMQETGSFDPEAAAALVARSMPKPADVGPTFLDTRTDFFKPGQDDEKLALLHRNPQAYEDAELREFARDPEAYVRETFGAAA